MVFPPRRFIEEAQDHPPVLQVLIWNIRLRSFHIQMVVNRPTDLSPSLAIFLIALASFIPI